jgi:opacity protein-like surface antigen
MRKILLASAAALLMGSAAAHADVLNAPYISVLGGWSSHPALAFGAGHDGVDDGYNVGVRAGTWLGGLPGVTADLDYFHNEGGFIGTGANLTSNSYMADLTYHVPVSDPLSLYGGAGAGVVTTGLNGSQHGSSTVFGWQALGGAEYRLSDTTAMFAEYRYQNAHNANVDTIANVGNTSNSISVGVKFGL